MTAGKQLKIAKQKKKFKEKFKETLEANSFFKVIKAKKAAKTENKRLKYRFNLYRKDIREAVKEAVKDLNKGKMPKCVFLFCHLDSKEIFLHALEKEGVSDALENFIKTYLDRGAGEPYPYYEVELNFGKCI